MKVVFICIVSLFILINSALGLTESTQKLILYETVYNEAATRSNLATHIPHYDIPIELVKKEFTQRLDARIANTLTFQKEGNTYIRWILNPEDAVWGEKIEQYFSTKYGLKLSKKFYYRGYRTASRSYIVVDPVSKVEFSVKSSTNITGGQWTDKKQPVGEAIDSVLISNFLSEQNRLRPFENFKFMDEPAIIAIPELDQAVVIRDLGDLKNPKNSLIYIPGFSVLHTTLGRQIAEWNGSRDPYAFWTEHYIKPAGRALGELAARTGLQYDSPHSQNFLVEVNEKFQPTGNIIFRDMADLYIDQTFMLSIEGKNSPTLSAFTQKENIHDYISAGFGPLHGNKNPSWVSKAQYAKWKDVFFQSFTSSFAKISGFDPHPAMIIAPYQDNSYFQAIYKLDGKIDSQFYQNLSEYKFTPPAIVVKCQALFFR